MVFSGLQAVCDMPQNKSVSAGRVGPVSALGTAKTLSIVGAVFEVNVR